MLARVIRSRPRVLIGAAIAAAAVAGGLIAMTLSASEEDEAPQASAAPSATPETASSAAPASPSAEPAPRPGDLIVTTAVDELQVFDEPGGAATMSLDKWSEATYVELTLAGLETLMVDGAEWIRVALPVQPNGTTGWVRADDVTVTSTSLSIHVFVAERELELRDGDTVLLATTVAVGAAETPTPLGTFYVTDPQEFPNPDGVYGAYALGLSGFSDVLETFNGAPPQIAIHGTNQPNLLGQAVSNGCIRMADADVLQIAARVELGTPVVIEESRAGAQLTATG